MSARLSGVVAWGAVVIATASTLAVLYLSLGALAANPFSIADTLNGWITVLVGALIVLKRRENPIGWVALLIGLSNCVGSFTEAYALIALPDRLNVVPGAVLAIWASQCLWVGIFIGLTLLLHLFPTGKPLDSFWRVVMWVSVAAELGLMLLFAVNSPMTVAAAYQTQIEVPNPFALVMLPTEGVYFGILIAILIVPIILALVAMGLRYRRARGVEREQIKWLLFAAAIFVVTLVISFATSNPIADALIELTALGMPIAVGIALFRYRLYDIDLIIRRTLTYGVVVALLAVVYLGVVLVLQRLFAAVSGQRSEVITVLSTLTIAALFVPLRNGIQAWIDRRFNRKKYDAQKVLADFAQTVRDETDLEKLTARLMLVVDETMQPRSMSVWLKKTEERK